MYIPQNRVINDLYTQGGQFIKIDTRESYIGYYHKTYQGRFFSGKNPSSENIVEIIEAVEGVTTPNDLRPVESSVNLEHGPFYIPSIYQSHLLDRFSYSNISSTNKNPFIDVHIHSYTHIPTSEEIEQGVFDMFLVIKTNAQSVTQIDKQSYQDLLNSNDEATPALYIPLTLPWVIKGEESKVYETNLNTIRTIQERNLIPNNLLVNYFKGNLTKNYLKYPGVIFVEKNSRITTNKQAIDTKLPEVYQLGNQVNYYTNTNIPPNQNCSNCKFAKENNCSKWNAMIQRNYWCKAYDGEFGKGELLSTESTQPLSSPTPQQPLSNYTSPTPSQTSSPSTGGGGYSGGGGY